jgi:hypothetical protein
MGHLACPFDGWSIDGIDWVVAEFEELGDPTSQTVERLRARNVSAEILDRVVIIELGNDASIFDALAPSHYYHRGKLLEWNQVGPELS